MWITSVYYHAPQDDKYGLSQALLSNLSEIAPEHFDQRIAYRVVCGKCLQEKKTPRHLDSVDHSILSFMHLNTNYLEKCHKPSSTSLTLWL